MLLCSIHGLKFTTMTTKFPQKFQYSRTIYSIFFFFHSWMRLICKVRVRGIVDHILRAFPQFVLELISRRGRHEKKKVCANTNRESQSRGDAPGQRLLVKYTSRNRCVASASRASAHKIARGNVRIKPSRLNVRDFYINPGDPWDDPIETWNDFLIFYCSYEICSFFFLQRLFPKTLVHSSKDQEKLYKTSSIRAIIFLLRFH